MRTRTVLLLSAAAGLMAAAGFAALSQAGGERGAGHGLSVVSRPLVSQPTAATIAPIPELARALPSFARARSAADALPPSDGTPREAILFGVQQRIDAGASRRVYAGEEHAVFAAPSPDRDKVCFALTADRPDAVWAHNFCGSSATVRTRPLIWSVSVARSHSDRRLVFAWGIASRAVGRVVVTSPSGALAATPNDDGIFVIDLAGRGDPTQIVAEDSRGRSLDRGAVPVLG